MLPIESVPFVTEIVPVKVLAVPARVTTPVLVVRIPMFSPLSPTLPPKVSAYAPPFAIVRAPPPKVTAPVPRFRALLPVKVRVTAPVLAKVMGLLPAFVMAAPEVLSMVLAAVTVKVPAVAPSALALLMFSVPADRVTPPVRPVLLPERVNRPAPALVRVPLPVMAPPTVRVLAAVELVMVRLLFIVTAPVPRFRLLEPVKVKFPSQTCGLFAVRVIALGALLLIVVPSLMVKVPVPSAVALLMYRVPWLSWTPPERPLLTPSRVRIPGPNLVRPAVPVMLLEILPRPVPVVATKTTASEEPKASVPEVITEFAAESAPAFKMMPAVPPEPLTVVVPLLVRVTPPTLSA